MAKRIHNNIHKIDYEPSDKSNSKISLAVHHWLNKYYGKATKCSNPNCKKKSNRYEWALKTGMFYEFNVDNFIQLCRSCHRKYDYDGGKHSNQLMHARERGLLIGKKYKKARCKLTDKQVKEIRIRYTKGETQTSLAKIYRIDSSGISTLVNMRSYAWVK